MINKKIMSGLIAGVINLSSVSVLAGFLDMPDMREVPALEEETMLLDMDIPSVRDRDPDPEAGVRINVNEFRVQGIVEFPQLGITREALAKKVEEIRFDIMGEQEILLSGYRLDELGQIADLLRKIETDTEGRHVTNLELQQMVFLMRDQMRTRGVTVGMIEAVADAISNFYRERGFILAKAFIPEQSVRGGIVNLTLLLGELGEVNVENHDRYSEKAIERIFYDDLHQPVTKDAVEENLYLLNDMPGLSVQGYFEPGEQVGDTQLQLNVQSEDRYEGNVRLDNHGSSSTGEYRLYADLFIFNPFGWSDEIQLGVLNSFNPDNTTYGSIRYNSFTFGPRWRLSTGVSSNDFVSTSVISGATLEATGESFVSDVSVGYFTKRSRKKNFSIELSYTAIQTELTISEVPQPDTSVGNTRLGFSFDLLNERAQTLHAGSMGLSYSSSTEDVESAQGTLEVKNNYQRLTFDYTMLKFLNFPFTKTETRLFVDVNGQYSGERQQSVNQFALTGPQRTRGFEVNRFFSDDGLRVGAEWMFKFPEAMNFDIAGERFVNVIQPYVLADIAYGVSHPFQSSTSALDEKVTATFSSVGLGFKFNFTRHCRGDFALSTPLNENVGGRDDEDSGAKAYFSLQYGF